MVITWWMTIIVPIFVTVGDIAGPWEGKHRKIGCRGMCRFGGLKAPFMLVCWTVRGVIASASHYKWHWHLTKHMQGLRSNGTSSNVLNHDTMPPDWWCLDLFSNHINHAFGDKFGLIELHLTAEERFPAFPLVLLVSWASPGVFHSLLPATTNHICPH